MLSENKARGGGGQADHGNAVGCRKSPAFTVSLTETKLLRTLEPASGAEEW